LGFVFNNSPDISIKTAQNPVKTVITVNWAFQLHRDNQDSYSQPSVTNCKSFIHSGKHH